MAWIDQPVHRQCRTLWTAAVHGGCLLCILFCLLTRAGAAEESGWDERLAGMFSGRLNEIDTELKELAPRLQALPGIPIDDQGGTGGFASIQATARPAKDAKFAVEIRWPVDAKVDLVALVPTRRYDAKGLDAQYGLPDSFTVELINRSGEVVSLVVHE